MIYELCDNCINRDGCKIYDFILTNNEISLDERYPKFEIILPQIIDNVCTISENYDTCTRLINSKNRYYVS